MLVHSWYHRRYHRRVLHCTIGASCTAAKKDIEKFEMFRGVMKCLLLSCACAAIVVLLMALDAFHKVHSYCELT